MGNFREIVKKKFANQSQNPPRVTSVALPGMETGVGRVPPRICARQMYAAFTEVIEEHYLFPRSWGEAQQRHQRLYSEVVRDLQAPAIADMLHTLDNLKLTLQQHKNKRRKEADNNELEDKTNC
jgi:O-acetyl-ADP-ribose deacetylase (regulator of RNase III)